MKLKDYLKDKAYLIIVALVLTFILWLFLVLTNVNGGIIFVVISTIMVLTLTFLVVEYLRRYHYYNSIINDLANLDEKYLLFDLIEEANFLDGQILYEILKASNFAMLDYVELYKKSQVEYERYIELWVHEIKTPLTSLKLLASNDNLNIDEELDEINHYIDQALFYAKKSAVAKDYLIESVNLKTVINNSIKALKTAFIKKDLDVKVNLEMQTVLSDSKWLEFMLKQVLLNSIKYSDYSSEIIINSYQAHNQVIVEIIDFGIGISQSDIRRVFDLGFTGSSGRKFSEASGIGLYLTKELASALNIGVKLESNSKTIFTFTFSLSDMYKFSNDNVS